MAVSQKIRRSFFAFLRDRFNPLTKRIAHSGHGPFAIVRHVGRRSGKPYETPLIVAPTKGGFVAELTYGERVDWFQNVRAAGGCRLLVHGREYTICGVQPLTAEAGRAAFPLPFRLMLRVLGRTHFVKLVSAR